VESTPHILVVGSDPTLVSEFESALSGISGVRAVTHFANNLRQGIEAARSRTPNLVCIEMDRNLRMLKSFTEELAVAAPEANITAIYRQDMFGPEDSEGAVIIEALRSRVQDFLRRPLSSQELKQILDRLHQEELRPRKRSLGKVYSFISNKGGVGKSTIATNIACTLAKRHPDRVLLIDASLQMGVCAHMLDLRPETSIIDAVREKNRLDETLMHQLSEPHPCGLRLLAAPKDAVEASEVDEDSMSLILSIARRAYDYVVVDTFPMLDSVVMAILDLSDTTHFVLQATVPNVIGAARHMDVMEGLGFRGERLKLILSRNHAQFSGNLEPKDIEERLGRKVDYEFPYSRRILVAVNTGRPYALHGPSWRGFGKTLRKMANDFGAAEEPKSPKEGRKGRRNVERRQGSAPETSAGPGPGSASSTEPRSAPPLAPPDSARGEVGGARRESEVEAWRS